MLFCFFARERRRERGREGEIFYVFCVRGGEKRVESC